MQPSPPIDSALFLWAVHLGRTSHLDRSSFHRQLAGVGPLIEQYAKGYRSGRILPALTSLAILELSFSAGAALSCFDGRTKLLKVWESLSNLYGVFPRSAIMARAALILALDALLLTEDPPPNVEIYVRLLDAELAAVDWEVLEQLSPDRAMQIQQIMEDWTPSDAEGDEMSGDRLW